jgi:hypothetical protein
VKHTVVKCNCDYCTEEMDEFEYEKAPTVTIRVDLPNPKGGAGQVAATVMKLCNKCSEKVGIYNSEEYHGYVYSNSRLVSTIEKCKTKILSLLKRGEEVETR